MKIKNTEVLSKGELNAKAELALMGLVVQIIDRPNMEYVLDYLGKFLKDDMSGKEIYDEAVKFVNLKKTAPIGVSVCRICGGEFVVINIIMKDKEDTNFAVDDEQGCLCHVHNVTAPDCSELGYCFFEKKGPSYHRIG